MPTNLQKSQQRLWSHTRYRIPFYYITTKRKTNENAGGKQAGRWRVMALDSFGNIIIKDEFQNSNSRFGWTHALVEEFYSSIKKKKRSSRRRKRSGLLRGWWSGRGNAEADDDDDGALWEMVPLQFEAARRQDLYYKQQQLQSGSGGNAIWKKDKATAYKINSYLASYGYRLCYFSLWWVAFWTFLSVYRGFKNWVSPVTKSSLLHVEDTLLFYPRNIQRLSLESYRWIQQQTLT